MSWNCNFVTRLPEGFGEDDLLFLRQLGVEYTYMSLPREKHTLRDLSAIVSLLRDHGLTMRNIQSNTFTFNADIALGLEHRDEALQSYCDFIEMCGEVGVRSIEQNMMPFFVYSSGIETTTRGAKTRTTDIDTMLHMPVPPLGRPAWINPDHEARQQELVKLYRAAEARGYTREELWDNFAYFTDRVIPVAEKAGVRISLHPADPPCFETIGGVPQLIRSFEDYKTAFCIANSRALGMTFCCGCWLEGGDRFGSVLEDMEYCLQNDLIEVVHVRNISAPLPHFDETFLDNGFYDYYPVFRLLKKYNYSGLVNPDHNPVMVDGASRRAPQSYHIGFMRAYAMRAAMED